MTAKKILPDSSILKINPELVKEWDFAKNEKEGLDIYKMTKGMTRIANWTCSEKHKKEMVVLK